MTLQKRDWSVMRRVVPFRRRGWRTKMSLNPALFALALLAGCAGAQAPPDPDETYIPFVKSDGIVEWQAASDDALYVKALTGGWYLVRTMGPCRVLRTALTVGFETSGPDELDRHGALRAEGRRCPVASVKRSNEPPPRARRRN
jgi:hypothetical protein